jgi:NAD(P)-dependent dehydrogenase (short-subunit alcohol dehydrogenase family)
MPNSSSSAERRVALVIGGSRGIGAAIVRRLARDGAAVGFTYAASADKSSEVVREVVSQGGKALAIRADSAEVAAVQAAVDQFTVDDFDRMGFSRVERLFSDQGRCCRHGSRPGHRPCAPRYHGQQRSARTDTH